MNENYIPSRCPECGSVSIQLETFLQKICLDKQSIHHEKRVACFEYQAYQCVSCKLEILNIEQADKWFSQFSRLAEKSIEIRLLKSQ